MSLHTKDSNIMYHTQNVNIPWWILYLKTVKSEGYDFFGVEKGW